MKIADYRPGDDGEPVRRSEAEFGPLVDVGEPQFASIQRNRSGQDAQEIDFRIRVSAIANLSTSEKQKLLRTAQAMLRSLETYCST